MLCLRYLLYWCFSPCGISGERKAVAGTVWAVPVAAMEERKRSAQLEIVPAVPKSAVQNKMKNSLKLLKASGCFYMNSVEISLISLKKEKSLQCQFIVAEIE